jgi:two-component system sensor kinase FixL
LEINRKRISFSPQNAILWYSITAGVLAACLIAFVVLYIESQERSYIGRVTQSTANGIQILIEEDIRKRIESLTKFSALSNISSDMSEDDWSIISQALYDTQQGYQAIGWVDSSFHVRKIMPIEGNEPAINFNLALNPPALTAVMQAKKHDSAVITVPLDSIHGSLGVGIYVPVFNTRQPDGELEGFIAGVLLFDSYINAVLPSYLLTEHQFTLFIDEQKIYSYEINEPQRINDWTKQAYFELQGQRWLVKLAPKNEFLSLTHFKLINVLILLGVLLSLFVALAVFTAMSSRHKTKLVKDDRKKTEQLLKNLPGMAYQAFHKPNWPMMFVSAGCEVLTGYSKLQFEQQNILWGLLIHPEDYERVYQTVNQAAKTRRVFELEYRIVTKDNNILTVWERGEFVSSMANDDVIIEGFITDVTSIKQAEADLIHSHAFSDAIVNSVVEAVISIDDNGLIKSFNAAAQDMFGYTFDEIKDKNVKALIPHQYSDYYDQHLAKVLENNDTHNTGTKREFEAKRKDGTTFPIHISISEIHNHEKQMFVGLIRDITQQRVAEDKARLHIEQLAHADRLNALGEMAASIAHEINQPLTAISLFSQTAKNFCASGKFEKLPELFEKLSQQSCRAGAVIQSVQVMTRRGDRPKFIIDCNTLIDEVIKLAESEARLRDISIKVQACNEHTNLFVDRVQIQQVILNLLRNGMEAMQAIACRNGAVIELRTKLGTDNQIEISVVDTGCGLDESMTEKLFTPFSSTKINGTGIGLSISKSIIEEHGGHIHFTENKPAGSIFYFTLPIHDEGRTNE